MHVGFRMTSPYEKSNACACIYVLIDPNDESVRYIGSTLNPAQRYTKHCTEATRLARMKAKLGKKHAWIKDLIESGTHPIFQVVAIVPAEHAAVAEQMLYHTGVRLGWDLLNGVKPNAPSTVGVECDLFQYLDAMSC